MHAVFAILILLIVILLTVNRYHSRRIKILENRYKKQAGDIDTIFAIIFEFITMRNVNNYPDPDEEEDDSTPENPPPTPPGNGEQ